MFLATSDFSMLFTIIKIIGGLALFLFGINLMSDSLKRLAGNKLKMIIEKTTNTPFKGILVGAFVTVLIQSSSGTTALTVGLVSAGLMTFPQAVGVIMGANIGTTVTSVLISLDVSKYALVFVSIGSFIIFFSKKTKVKEFGNVVLGFGLLFYGLELMGTGLDAILAQYSDIANNIFQTFGQWPVLGLFVGIIFTALIQSSAAAIGILQSLYAVGNLSLVGAIPILLGANIGTCITAVLAAWGSSVEAKRTALVHALFNIIGALIFMILLRWAYAPFIHWFELKMHLSAKMTISVAHIIFNLVSTFILFFFIKYLVLIANKVIKDKEEENVIIHGLSDYSLISRSPAVAIEFAKKAVDYMGERVIEYFNLTKNFSFTNIQGAKEKADNYEQEINSLDKRIHDYLIKFTLIDSLDKDTSNKLSKYLDTIKDLERIGDHCTNIVDFFNERYDDKQTLSTEGAEDLKTMYDALDDMVHSSILSLASWNKDMALGVSPNEEKVDKMEEVFRKKHILRINNGICSVSSTDYYVDILSNLERIGDHSNNIASNVINDEYCQFDEFNH